MWKHCSICNERLKSVSSYTYTYIFVLLTKDVLHVDTGVGKSTLICSSARTFLKKSSYNVNALLESGPAKNKQR